MKRIAFVIPWFGKLPPYFRLWLKTAEANDTIDFLIFTDNKINYHVNKNIHITYMSWDKLRILFQRKFEFKISLNKAYKLCDFKPAYGDIFEDYLIGYDFWGHCDVDTLFGNVRKFITDDILEKYNRILPTGPFSLYKNTKETNLLYRTLNTNKYQKWFNVYQQDDVRCFDEYGEHLGGGLTLIMEENNFPIYKNHCYAELVETKSHFIIYEYSNKSPQRFVWNNGSLYSEVKDDKTEWLYLHFIKRGLNIDKNIDYESLSKVYLYPPKEITTNNLYKSSLLKMLHFKLSQYYKLLKSYLKRKINS